jgi:hypothetical protein
MSKTVTAIDRKKSFESNFANEVRRLVRVRQIALDVAEGAARQQRSTRTQGIAQAIIDAGTMKYALTVDPDDPADRLLRDTFSLCDLDSTNPRHWRILLETIIELTFKKSGAPEKWDEAALFELQMDIRELQRLEPSATHNKKIAELLRKKEPFKSKYGMGFGYLRKLVGKARDARFNRMVEFNEDQDFLKYVAEQRRRRSGVSPEIASSLVEKAVEELIQEKYAEFKRRWEDEGRTWGEKEHEENYPIISKIVRERLSGKREE